jgi:DNA-binding response OmpR family regulator
MERTLTIFVVDDDPYLRHFVEAWIASRTRLEVRAFENGWAAIQALAVYAPTHVLSDLDMPGTSGEEVARAAAALQDPPRIVLMSGDFDRLDRARPLADQTLVKPFDIDELMASLVLTK